MKILKIESSIVFRCEESLDLYDGKKKLDKVVSGRVIKEVIEFLGIKLRVKYQAEYCCPVIDKEDLHVRNLLEKAAKSVKEKCENKIRNYYNNGR